MSKTCIKTVELCKNKLPKTTVIVFNIPPANTKCGVKINVGDFCIGALFKILVKKVSDQFGHFGIL